MAEKILKIVILNDEPALANSATAFEEPMSSPPPNESPLIGVANARLHPCLQSRSIWTISLSNLLRPVTFAADRSIGVADYRRLAGMNMKLS